MKRNKKILAAAGLFLSAITISSLAYSASINKIENEVKEEVHSHYKTLESTKREVSYSFIAGGWNNAYFPSEPGYRHLIMAFGDPNTVTLTDSGLPDPTNQAKSSYDIGKKLKINGLPIYKIAEKFPLTSVDYAHGHSYIHVIYPEEITLAQKNGAAPTFYIEEGTEFEDVTLPEVNLTLLGGSWYEFAGNNTYKIDDPTDLDPYLQVTLPHHIGASSHALFAQLPEEGSKLAFNINTGEMSQFIGDAVINFDNFYKTRISIYLNAGIVALTDLSNGAVVQQVEKLRFSPNCTYRFEIAMENGSNSNLKFALDHVLVLDYTFGYNKTGHYDTWVIDTSGALTMDYFEDLPRYQPSIINGGSSTYDFIAGDPLYNFIGVIDGLDLYDESVTAANISYEYEDGAVSDGRYNEGSWNLTVRLTLTDGSSITKDIHINVHGNTSVAKIYFGDDEPIDAPLGSKLVAPANPQGYREGDFDYVFDGWYFEGARWDFDNDVVQGDMHLVATFRAVPIHYVVTVSFEGLSKAEETYSLSSGNNLPFILFDEDGATYEVYKDGQPITSLEVTEDVSIVVKYTVAYTFVAAKEATCTEDGNDAYWYSEIYKGYYFADPNGRELLPNPIIPKLNHSIVHLDYKDSTCSEVGNLECYYCQNCDKHFEDMDGQVEKNDWAIEKKPHIVSHQNAKDPTCEADGWIEHYTCANEPDTYYADEECSIKLESVSIEALGHDFRNAIYEWNETANGYECKASIACTHCNELITETKAATKTIIREASCDREGQISYSVKFEDERFNAQTKIVTVAKKEHTYVHYDAVAATEKNDGVKEHYECSSCHKYFLKNGNTYTEVAYIDLLVKYTPSKSGCGGNIATSSIVLSVTAGAFVAVMMMKRKKER